MDPLTIGAILAGIKGIIDHDDAKKKNKKARKKIRKADQIYETAKNNLEIAYTNARNALEQYGLYKQFVMNTSITRFYRVSQRIRETELIIYDTDDQFSSLMIKPDEIESLYYTTVQCNNHLAAAGKGGAFGAILLAASGSAPVATALASLPGGTLLTGVTDIGLLGSAAIIAGPAICFFGASELKEAKENLSNAKAYKASAEAAAAKMDTMVIKIDPIGKWSKMQTDQLRKFNQLFVMSISMLEELVESLARLNPEENRINVRNLSKQQRELIAISYTLARYVKIIIDTPLLQKLNVASREESIADYSVTDDSIYYYNENEKQIPKLETGVKTAKQIGFPVQVLEKIESDALEVQTINPLSQRAQQLVAEAEIPRVYSFREPVTETESLVEEQQELAPIKEESFNTNNSGFSFVKKIAYVLIILGVIYYAFTYFADNGSKGTNQVAIPEISEKKESSKQGTDDKTTKNNQISIQSQKEALPPLIRVTDSNYGYTYFAPSSGVKSDTQPMSSSNHYQLLNGKIKVTCEAKKSDPDLLKSEYQDSINGTDLKKLESVQNENWYYSVTENQKTKEIVAQKYYYGDTMKQGITILLDADTYNSPEIKKVVQEIFENFKPSVKPSAFDKSLVGSIGTINANEVNIRKGFSKDYQSLGVFYKGDKVKIVETGKNSDGESWYKIEYNNPSAGLISGWVKAEYIDTTSDTHVTKPSNVVVENKVENNTPNKESTVKFERYTDKDYGYSFDCSEKYPMRITDNRFEKYVISGSKDWTILIGTNNGIRDNVEAYIGYESVNFRNNSNSDDYIKQISKNGYEMQFTKGSYGEKLHILERGFLENYTRVEKLYDRTHYYKETRQHYVRLVFKDSISIDELNDAKHIIDSFKAKE